MYILIFIVIGLIIGRFSGGEFKNILNIKLNKLWLVIPLLICTVCLRIAGLKGVAINNIVVFIIEAIIMAVFIWFNRKYFGLLVSGFGFALNALVSAVNGGKMPVDYNIAKRFHEDTFVKLVKSGKDIKHVFINSHTKLSFLSDRIYVPKYLATIIKPDIASTGDIIMGVGIMILAITFMRCKQ